MVDCDELKILLEKLFFKNIPEYEISYFSVKNNSDIDYTFESRCVPQYTSYIDFLNELTKDSIIKNIHITEYLPNLEYKFSRESVTKANGFRVKITLPIKNVDKLKFLLKVSI